MTVLDALYSLSHPFVGHAWRAFAVAAVAFLAALATRFARKRVPIGGRTVSPTPWIVVTVAWALFGACEAEATREHSDIRVDLLVSWPVLCLVTLVCAVIWIRAVSAPHRRAEQLPR
ncbi:MAG: hypothetical protein JWN53_2165 [Gemmatimonadetes bacterium]|nr:hypothetical protein [Gemmatimonadota bacterium]